MKILPSSFTTITAFSPTVTTIVPVLLQKPQLAGVKQGIETSKNKQIGIK